MSRKDIQFAVALVGVLGLVICTIAAVIAVMFFNAMSNQLAFTLVGGLTTLTVAAAAWLFQSNEPDNGRGRRR